MLDTKLAPSLKAASLVVGAFGLAACATYPAEPGYGGGASGPAKPSAPVAATANVEGCWAFTDKKGRQNVNFVEALDEETILVSRSGENQVFQYFHIGGGVFQAEGGPATYRFNGRIGTWNSNKSPPTTYRLSYAGYNC